MTKRLTLLAVALGATGAFAVQPASAAVCTHRPLTDCVQEWIGPAQFQLPCIPTGDLEDRCPR